MSKNKRVLLDMDGVIVDFVRGALKYHRMEHKVDYSMVTWDFDKLLFPHDQEEFWRSLGRDFWFGLDWHPVGKVFFDELYHMVGRTHLCICTSPCRTSGSTQGKLDWISHNLPAESSRNFMIAPHKDFSAGPDNILVDDRPENVERFKKRGGKAVLVPAPWNERKCDLVDEYNYDPFQILDEVEVLWS